MNVYTIARELVGNLELAPDQLAGLRALDRKYAQRLYSLRHDSDTTALRDQLVSDILALLAPEQQKSP